jgi:tetratricopeptide (TPR) repeat protein
VLTSRPPRFIPDQFVGGRYHVLSELGRGGMSTVYQAHDGLLNRDVALKLLKSYEEPKHLLYLQQEFRSMARLRHPRIVQVFDYGILETGVPYFTMELLKGADLSTFRNLPLRSVFHVLLAIADALGFMHVRGYAHRDVKPSNVRLLPSDPDQPLELKLMDCGLTAKFDREDHGVAGTPAYLAPEAWAGARPDARGDLYALGVLAYEITAGTLPFDTTTGVRLFKAKTEQPKDLRAVRSDVPAEFARLVRDLLMPEPAGRPASAMEVIARLSELADVSFHPDPAAYLHTPAFVGRSQELAALRDAINGSFAGKPTPTVVVGPAGSGKTRLLDEILLEIGLKGAVVAKATGRGFSGGPYEVLRELILPLMHLPAAEAVLSRIGGRQALLPAGGSIPSGRDDRHADPVAARQSFHRTFATFLDGLSKHRCVILAVEDIHWADAASVDALAGLAATGTYGNIALVATQRAGEHVFPSLAHLLSNARLLEMSRMTKAQISDLIVAALGPATPSPALVEELERASAGNVYFVLEILRSLAASGLIERKRTRIVLPDSLIRVKLPANLSEAIEFRLASLSASALALARVAGVAGRSISLEFARALTDSTDDEFLDAVDELQREDLVKPQARELVIHPRLQEILYQGMNSDQRRILHRRVAEAMLASPEHDARADAAALGNHFAESGNGTLALEYLVKAGDARYDDFAYYDAFEAYRRAFELLPSAPFSRRRELQRKLNDRLGRIGFYYDHRNGTDYLERAGRHHLDHGILWTIAPLSRVLGSLLAVVIAVGVTALFNLLRFRRRPLERALDRLTDSFAATTYLANCFSYSGRAHLALDAAERLLPFVYSRHRIPRAGYLLARAYALCLTNRLDGSASACEEALIVLQSDQKTRISEHDRVHGIGGALVVRLWVDLLRGYTKRSCWFHPFELFVLEHPTVLLLSWLLEVRVYAGYRQGNINQTEAAWKQFTEKASQTEVMFVQNKTRVWLGMAYLDVGRTSAAQDLADEVIRAARDPENPYILALGLQLRGMALHAWEQLDDAQVALEEAAQLSRRADVESWELHHSILLRLALLLFDRKNYTGAEALARKVQERTAAMTLAHDLHDCRASRLLGRIALAQGSVETAVTQLERSVALACEMDDSLERARSYHYLALATAAQGEDAYAERCHMDCQELLSELGNTHLPHILGYVAQQKPESVKEPPPSSARVKGEALSTESSKRITRNALRTSSARSIDSVGESLLNLPEAALRDETLVATSPSEPLLDKPD